MEDRMETLITGQLAAFNQLYKEIDQIYHEYARCFVAALFSL